MNKQKKKLSTEDAIRLAHLREEQWRIVESDNPDWDRWNEIEDEIAEKTEAQEVL